MSTDEYVPDEEQVRAWCREGTGDCPDVMDEWLDRFLARIRRDAWDEGAQAQADTYGGQIDTGPNPHETGDQA